MTMLRLLLYFLLLFSCQVQAGADLFQQRTLRTGFYVKSFPDVSRADLEIAVRYWSEEVGHNVGIPVLVYFYNDLQTMRKEFYQGKINFIVASPLPIVSAFDLSLLVDGYKIIIEGSANDNILVVSHKDSELQGFKSLQGKSLSLLEHEPISDVYAQILALNTFGKTAQQVFKKISYIKKSNRLIFDLFFNETDVILVYQTTYDLACELNPQIRKKTAIVGELANIPRGLGFFHRHVPPEFREFVLSEVEKLHADSRGKQLLAIFKGEKAVRSSLSDLESAKQLQQQYLQLSTQYGIK